MLKPNTTRMSPKAPGFKFANAPEGSFSCDNPDGRYQVSDGAVTHSLYDTQGPAPLQSGDWQVEPPASARRRV